MSFAARVKALGLPLDEVVVVGSGLLDQLGLRASGDVDLVVSPKVFDTLSRDGSYELGVKDGNHFCVRGDLDIWDGWHEKSFAVLRETAQQIDGVWFVGTDMLIAKKRERGLEKDIKDIELLEKYNARSY